MSEGAGTSDKRPNGDGEKVAPWWGSLDKWVHIATIVGVLGSLYYTREQLQLTVKNNSESANDTKAQLDETKKAADAAVVASNAANQSAAAATAAASEMKRLADAAEASQNAVSEQLRLSSETFALVDRPRLTITPNGGQKDPPPRDNEIAFPLAFSIENRGRSMASQIAFKARVVPFPSSESEVQIILRQLCVNADKAGTHSTTNLAWTGETGGKWFDSEPSILRKSDVAKRMVQPSGQYGPVLLGCLTYRIPYSGGRRITQFAYVITFRDRRKDGAEAVEVDLTIDTAIYGGGLEFRAIKDWPLIVN